MQDDIARSKGLDIMGVRANLRAEAPSVMAELAGLSCEGRLVDSAAA